MNPDDPTTSVSVGVEWSERRGLKVGVERNGRPVYTRVGGPEPEVSFVEDPEAGTTTIIVVVPATPALRVVSGPPDPDDYDRVIEGRSS